MKQAHLKHHVSVVKMTMMTAVTPKMRSLSTLVLRACEERCVRVNPEKIIHVLQVPTFGGQVGLAFPPVDYEYNRGFFTFSLSRRKIK